MLRMSDRGSKHLGQRQTKTGKCSLLSNTWYLYVRKLLQNCARSLRMAKTYTFSSRKACWLATMGLLAPIAFAQHSATIKWTQPTQPVGETVSSTKVKKSGTTIASVTPTTLSYTDTVVSAGDTVSYTLTNVDSNGTESVPSAAIVALIPGSQTPPPTTGISLFTTQTPVETNLSDGSVNYELGTKFKSSVAGQVTAIRYWKGTKEVGTHIGHIWGPIGALLTTVTFVNETASGWQQQLLPAPLSISAGTTYTVSVNTVATFYSATTGGLSYQIINGTLSSDTVGNGSYALTVGRYPTYTWQSSNYFRDIVFVSGGGTPPPPQQGMTTICSFPTSTLWRCDSTLVNIPTGQIINSVTTTDSITNATSGNKP